MIQVPVPVPIKVIFNENATVVFFEDGSKTIVRKMASDTENREVAIFYSLFKRALAIDINPQTMEVTASRVRSFMKLIMDNAIVQKPISAKKQAKKPVEKKKEAVEKKPAPEKVKPWPKTPTGTKPTSDRTSKSDSKKHIL